MASQQEYSQTPSETGARADTGIALSVSAIVLGVISVLFFPIILGPIGIVLAAVAKSRGERLANVALAVAIIGPILGFVLALFILESGGLLKR